MRRIGTLVHGDVVVPQDGRGSVQRTAVRGVVRRGRDVLLVETSDGELKMPGGEVVEHAPALEPGDQVVTMTSRYCGCAVADVLRAQRLDDYERDLGLAPVWVGVDEAVRVLRAAEPGAHRWARRELLVLELLAAEPA